MAETISELRAFDGPGWRTLEGALAGSLTAHGDAIKALARERRFAAGEWIVRQGEAADTLYILNAGSVDVIDVSGGEEHLLASLVAGEFVGEIAFLDGAARSAGVRAREDVVALEVREADLRALPSGDTVSLALKAAIGATLAKRVRRNNDKYVAAMEREVEALQERRAFGLFYIYSIAVLGLGMVTYGLILENLWDIDPRSTIFSWQYLAMMMLPTMIVAHVLGVPRRTMGLTHEGLGRSILEGTAIGLVLFAAVGALAMILGGKSLSDLSVRFDWLALGAYALHSFLQELFGRGFLQTAFQRFLGDENGFLSVVLSAGMFSVFHVHFGLMAVGLTFAGGMVFGAIFLRHRNIAGVTIAHILPGAAGFAFGIMG
ncbi:cyclic nucleotide-binding domain-containing protein [Albimonas sp. CAU 1670]|uniref:cyclic nucleotide-binding domain-containing protein n=1 Tax=Albimonas sp. CAU 1670 TaxID=3032599 RepID=UPI0023D9F82C|nr:cyclic nucleotide-binding domain-containing protein [Albimonas sp. CAU 1670]MDF2234817.1 cyclic nucleotide-binding domain-containing protein [Albimonas sp. CAU 1670]